MKCSVCGSDNLDGSAYCEDCGARLPVGGATPAASNPPPAPASPTPPTSEETEPTPEPSGEGGVLVCASCGAENPSYEAYCEDCGASLSGTSGSPPAVSVSSQSEPVAVAAPAVARIRLSLADGSREFPVSKDTIEIGRRSPVDGIYPDVDLTDVDTESFISRRHGRVLKGESGVLYEDLGSSNGSFLNDTRLQAGVQTALKDGDRLRLGKTEMVFRAS
ncbi:FHA domain-containing protein [bacterium CPR1]|nr:FHA domain-containing protein [bacterium CPR1]